MRPLHFLYALLFSCFVLNLNAQVTVYPQGLTNSLLQVHDSISPFTEFKITHGLNTGQGLKTRLLSSGTAEIHNRLNDMILTAGATGPGAYMFLEASGDIGIGYPKFLATNALHIRKPNPLRLEGLGASTTFDSVLVVSPTGVVFKRAQSTFPVSYWTKSDNFVFNTTDSVGIGLSSPSERLAVREAAKIISPSNNAKMKLESVSINSEFGQYKFGTSDLLLGGTLPASGLTYISGLEGTSDVVSSQGLLLNVEGKKPIIFGTNDNEAMRIDSSGRLGIGTEFPRAALDVEGEIWASERVEISKSHLKEGEFGELVPHDQDLSIYAPWNLQLGSFGAVEMVDPRTSEPWAYFDNFRLHFGIDTLTPWHEIHVNGDAKIEDSLIVPRIVMGPDEKTLFYSDFTGFSIQNNHTFSDNRDHLMLKNGYDHNFTLKENTLELSKSGTNYIQFDGARKSMSINRLFPPRETIDIGGSAFISDTIVVSDYSKIIAGKNSQFLIKSDDEINIVADENTVNISNGSLDYAVFDGEEEKLILSSAGTTRNLEVQGSAVVGDSLILENSSNALLTTSSSQVKLISDDDILLSTGSDKNLRIQNGSSTYVTFDGADQRVGIGAVAPDEALEVNGTIETDKIKITDGAIPGRVLVSDGDGLGTWSTVPPDADWIVSGTDMQSGVPGNITIGLGGVQNSKVAINGSVAKSIKVVGGPSYVLTSNDYTVVFDDPMPMVASLPAANTCPGRIYKLKFTAIGGGSIVPSLASDLIDKIPGTFMVASPSTVTIQSDGSSGWWIID